MTGNGRVGLTEENARKSGQDRDQKYNNEHETAHAHISPEALLS
jgi:hypothetical protein